MTLVVVIRCSDDARNCADGRGDAGGCADGRGDDDGGAGGAGSSSCFL